MNGALKRVFRCRTAVRRIWCCCCVLHAAPVVAAVFPRVNPEFAAPGPGDASRGQVASEALIENAPVWDGRIVSFAGEAVGEAMIRGDHAWLHVNDDDYQARNHGESAPARRVQQRSGDLGPAGVRRVACACSGITATRVTRCG